MCPCNGVSRSLRTSIYVTALGAHEPGEGGHQGAQRDDHAERGRQRRGVGQEADHRRSDQDAGVAARRDRRDRDARRRRPARGAHDQREDVREADPEAGERDERRGGLLDEQRERERASAERGADAHDPRAPGVRGQAVAGQPHERHRADEDRVARRGDGRRLALRGAQVERAPVVDRALRQERRQRDHRQSEHPPRRARATTGARLRRVLGGRHEPRAGEQADRADQGGHGDEVELRRHARAPS